MVEVGLVDGRKGVGASTVTLRAKGDGRVAARTKVESCTAHLAELLGGVGGVACGLCCKKKKKKRVVSFPTYSEYIWEGC